MSNDLEGRVALLEGRVDAVSAEQQQTSFELRQEVAARRQAVDDLHGHVTRLDGLLVAQQHAAVKVDATALPIVLIGAALTTFDEELSRIAVVGDLAICIGVGFFFWAWALLDRERDNEAPAS